MKRKRNKKEREEKRSTFGQKGKTEARALNSRLLFLKLYNFGQ